MSKRFRCPGCRLVNWTPMHYCLSVWYGVVINYVIQGMAIGVSASVVVLIFAWLFFR